MDPRWPSESPYQYAKSAPTRRGDPSGTTVLVLAPILLIPGVGEGVLVFCAAGAACYGAYCVGRAIGNAFSNANSTSTTSSEIDDLDWSDDNDPELENDCADRCEFYCIPQEGTDPWWTCIDDCTKDCLGTRGAWPPAPGTPGTPAPPTLPVGSGGFTGRGGTTIYE